MSKNPKFIHLRLHSEYSLLEGAIRLKKIPEMCISANMPAVAVTDTNNLFGALEFSEYASSAGIQPILGCQMDLSYLKLPEIGASKNSDSIVLLVQNEIGYKNLLKLNSRAYFESEGQAQIEIEDLRLYSEGLICLTGGAEGPVGRLLNSDKISDARQLLVDFLDIFKSNLYIELQRHPGENGLPNIEAKTESLFIDLAYELQIPLVATNDVHFHDTEMYEAHDCLSCIYQSTTVNNMDRKLVNKETFFKKTEVNKLVEQLANGDLDEGIFKAIDTREYEYGTKPQEQEAWEFERTTMISFLEEHGTIGTN